MMDNGQPGPKRLRMEQGQGPFSRELPPPSHNASAPHYPQHGPPYARQPDPQANPLDAHRRHSAQAEHQQKYDSESRRSNSGPSAHAYHHHPPTQPPQQPPYGGRPQDSIMKREPGDEVPPLGYRSLSTGSATDHNVIPTHAEGRYQQAPQHLPPFDVARHQGPPHQGGPSYAPPQSPMPTNESYGHPAYINHGLPPRQDQYPVTYPATSASTQKRKAQRAAQACDSCRTLKAKCDEGRPGCSSCIEKQISCVYRDPPPKQQDRGTAELIENMNRIESSIAENIQTTIENTLQGTFQTSLGNAISNAMRAHNDGLSRKLESLSERMAEFEKALPATALAAGRLLKDEPEETKTFSTAPDGFDQTLMQIAPSSDPQQYHAEQAPFASHAREDLAMEPPQPLPDTIQVSEEEEETGEPVNPGQSSIPVNHTTGAARLLLVRPIAELARGILVSNRIKNEKYPMLQEERRGLLRLYGRGEGTERLPGYDKDPLTDHGYDSTNAHTPSDTSSEVSSPPGEEWGQLGGLTPPGEPIARGLINEEGMPDLTPTTVWTLVQSYEENINNMHPILVPKHLDALVKHFLKSIQVQEPKPKQVSQLAATQSSSHAAVGFVGNRPGFPESPGTKRKRSTGTADTYDVPLSTITDHKPGHPPRSVSSAIVLLMMALGKICLTTGKIADCVPDGTDQSWGGSPTIRNGHPMSPLRTSPAMSTISGLPSPVDGDTRQPKSRRSSLDGHQLPTTTGTKPRNLDAIPGLQYFGMATDIIGNQAGGNGLPHVHANILASLYHGQLGRPLESHSYLHQACRSLQVILRPKLDRFKRLNLDSEIPPATDNPLIFAFWTCLQLESDIVAELPVPHSGILTYEEDMPGPNLQAAKDIDKLDELVVESYGAQLHMRKHLNRLHNMFFRPDNDSEFPSVFNAKNVHHFPTIDESLAHLERLSKVASHMQWNENDPPASDILRARLRAKYYGAKVITFRHSLVKVLNHSHNTKPGPPNRSKTENPNERTPEEWSEELKPGIEAHLSISKGATRKEDIDPKVYEYASNCINALIKSTTAFHGMGDPGKKRLIVTNIWGTAHAQWGNILTLQAAFVDPILGPLIDRKVLIDLYLKTVDFLKLVAQPSSALHIDYKILEHVAKEIDLIPKPGQANSSFSSATSGDVPMTG